MVWAAHRFIVAALVGMVAASVAACQGDVPQWTGGPHTAGNVPVTFNPRAMPVGDTVPTGIVVSEKELVLYFWGSGGQKHLGTAWLDRGVAVPGNGAVPIHYLAHQAGFLDLSQAELPDGRVVDFGAYEGTAARFTIGGVEARFTVWSHDRLVTIFWAQRKASPLKIGAQVELKVYDIAGTVLKTVPLTPVVPRENRV